MNYYDNASEDEKKFLDSYDPSKFPITVSTVDMIVSRYSTAARYEVLMVKRGNYPYKGMWALPGGFIDPGETTKEAALRELREEAGLTSVVSEVRLWGVADAPDRDPRGRAISTVYKAHYVGSEEPYAGDDAVEARWFATSELCTMELAFDHHQIIFGGVK